MELLWYIVIAGSIENGIIAFFVLSNCSSKMFIKYGFMFSHRFISCIFNHCIRFEGIRAMSGITQTVKSGSAGNEHCKCQ